MFQIRGLAFLCLTPDCLLGLGFWESLQLEEKTPLGHFQIRLSWREWGKIYICLFVCTATHTVHLQDTIPWVPEASLWRTNVLLLLLVYPSGYSPTIIICLYLQMTFSTFCHFIATLCLPERLLSNSHCRLVSTEDFLQELQAIGEIYYYLRGYEVLQCCDVLQVLQWQYTCFCMQICCRWWSEGPWTCFQALILYRV